VGEMMNMKLGETFKEEKGGSQVPPVGRDFSHGEKQKPDAKSNRKYAVKTTPIS